MLLTQLEGWSAGCARLGVPISIVSVGQDRVQTIVRDGKRLWG
jgi:hypothetical protein